MGDNFKISIINTIFFSVLFTTSSLSQDVVVIEHKAYKSTFSVSKKHPILVEWWLTKKMLSCDEVVERTDDFKADPSCKDVTDLDENYKGSGYDRGHVFPAQYGACDIVIMKESFYFSNVFPQTPQLNRGDWKTVEELTKMEARQFDSVYVWAGSLGGNKKIGSVSVPELCWKVIYIKKTKEYFAFLHKNDFSKPDGINNNKVDLKTIERITGRKFVIK